MTVSPRIVVPPVVGLLVLVAAARAEEGPPADAATARAFAAVVRPMVQRYCLECHSTEEQEGELDLERFAGLDQVRNAASAWRRVAEQVASGEMPPKGAIQPTAAERAQFGAWVQGVLAAEAARTAGDPGRVVLRRLNNAEYTYTLRDLTGLDAIEPAREFPADGAAGEGFTNTGQALVMSPSLVTKYLDAAKEIAGHAVLLPDGFRFSAKATARDWTEEALGQIRQFYAEFTDAQRGGLPVDLQGVVFTTNGGGRLPVERYLAATVGDREALTSGSKTSAAVAAERGLNARYLATLWQELTKPAPSLVLAGLQARWRTARPEDVPALAAEVAAWQKALWQFGSVGQIGKANGPKSWLTPVDPLASSQPFRVKLPPAAADRSITVSLVAADAGDGDRDDLVIWHEPRLVAPGRPDIPLRSIRPLAATLEARRADLFRSTARYLAAAGAMAATPGRPDVATLARERGLDPSSLRAWVETVGGSQADPVVVSGHFATELANVGGHDFIQGWGGPGLPQVLANASDGAVRIPGRMKPHGVAVHPSPTLRAAVGWQSPVAAVVQIQALIAHAHPECGNGVSWSLEHRRGSRRTRLAAGIAQGSKEGKPPLPDGIAVQPGDVIAVAVGPRDGNHVCDLTAVDLRIAEANPPRRTWDLAADVSGDIRAGNPHADRLGHPGVWHFWGEPDAQRDEAAPALPAGSILARWQATPAGAGKERLAAAVERLLAPDNPAPGDGPDAALRRQLWSLRGPLLGPILRDHLIDEPAAPPEPAGQPAWGLDPARFGPRNGMTPEIEPTSLGVAAPSVVTVRIPAELAEGAELVTTARLSPSSGPEASAQVEIVPGVPPARGPGLQPSDTVVTLTGAWTESIRHAKSTTPVLVADHSAGRRRFEAAFADVRNLFPAALCYPKIVPVDEVITLTLFYREDEHLARLMLDEPQKARLDRLWDELHFVSRDALTEVDAFAQLLEFASQDGDPKTLEPLRRPILDRAARFRRGLSDAEPAQVAALVDFAGRAYRRPLKAGEADQVRALYAQLRGAGMPHEDAFRLTLARILVAPAFLYRLETPGAGSAPGPVAPHELATRLSYFLWSAPPDAELRDLADSGQLPDPAQLCAQARRLLADARIRRLATEFAGHWLQIADFDRHDEKSERHFPTFLGLRGAMHEESTRFLTDLFQRDGSVLDLLDADHTYLNAPLAEHYGIPFEASRPDEWRRVEGVRAFGRGGVLAQAATLAQQSGASRTSPTLRGNWISEVLLGERLPRPPKGVAQLPEDESATAGLTVRQLVEQHASNAQCAGCHRRIDPLGFALESYDAIGRRRSKDLGDRPVDNRSRTLDGAEFAGLGGLQTYLLATRRDAFVRQFCRKLLGFALGRGTQLADEALLTEMQASLRSHDYRVGVAIERIVASRQFREIRGRDAADAE